MCIRDRGVDLSGSGNVGTAGGEGINSATNMTTAQWRALLDCADVGVRHGDHRYIAGGGGGGGGGSRRLEAGEGGTGVCVVRYAL